MEVRVCYSGLASPAILATYELERRQVALDLIEFDRRFSKMFSGKPAKDLANEAGVSMTEFKKTFELGNVFTSGISVTYPQGFLIAKSSSPRSLPVGESTSTSSEPWLRGLHTGMRFPSFQVVRQVDARPLQLADVLKSDGRWRLIVFAGDILRPELARKLQDFGNSLSQPTSFLQRFGPNGQKSDFLIEVLLVHASPRESVEIFSIHKVFRPFRQSKGWDYSKIFADDESYHNGHGQAYENYEVSKLKGLTVVVRPDQYIGLVGATSDVDVLERYFSGILLDPKHLEAKKGKGVTVPLASTY